ncbi:MAG TPA: hypothetical protein VNI84_00385 [Pyrinomonadaceae bacterium]|nr:hypothetical protein [Pyrinomonadaceae bacterium]
MKNTVFAKSIAALLVIIGSALAADAQCGGSKKNCPPNSPPPLGNYTCNITRWDVSKRRIVYDYQGYFTLKAGGAYSWLDNGGAGKYAYDAKTYRIDWTGGHLANLGAITEFGLDGDDPEITLTIKTESGDTVWQCALEK